MRLLPHPETPVDLPLELLACGQRRGPELEFEYRLDGALAAVRWPASVGPVRRDQLWQHTCFEAFLAAPGRPAYCEFNFSPGGAWAAYRFAVYRGEPAPLELGSPPRIHVTRRDASARLVASVAAGAVLELLGGSREFELGLSAVIESAAGARSYWALQHAPGRPDFHDRRAFTAALAS